MYRYVYRGTRRREVTFCPCQPREIAMRFMVLVLVILLTETSRSSAQGHMGTPQEQQACRRDAQSFADSNWVMMERFNNACSRTGPD